MGEGLIIKSWTLIRGVVALAYCTFACAEPISFITPMNVADPGQIVSKEFVVERDAGYTFAILFVWGADYTYMEKQSELWEGRYQRKGVSLPVHLRILKDDSVFFDEVIVTTGLDGGASIDVASQKKPVGIRTIKNFKLSPGRYWVEVKTVSAVEVFKVEECYIQISTYDPKI